MNISDPSLSERNDMESDYIGPEYTIDTATRMYNAILELNSTATNPATDNVIDNSEEVWRGYIQLLQDRALLVTFLLLFSLATVFGNALVILAVVRERYLHTSTNYFVVSLAVADCLVGLVVMPFSALYEVLEHTWFFGVDWCDVWRSLDVLFSTASILNLCVISLDRYWAITDPITYPMKMSGRRALYLIGAVWVCSGAISFPAIAWWRAVRLEEVPDYRCPFTENLEYIIFSSTISFYLPLFVMVFTYYRIYRAATIQTRSLKIGTKQVLRASGELELTLRIHRGGTVRERSNLCHHHGLCTPEDFDELNALNNGLSRSTSRLHCAKHAQQAQRQNFSLSRKLTKFAKEKKAAKTLGIVMGVFVVCWLPFFVVNLLTGICSACISHVEIVNVIVTWLGWVNSSMNPVIYACWSRDFRRAFLRIICQCCPRNIRRKYQPQLRFKQSQVEKCPCRLQRGHCCCECTCECHFIEITTTTTTTQYQPRPGPSTRPDNYRSMQAFDPQPSTSKYDPYAAGPSCSKHDAESVCEVNLEDEPQRVSFKGKGKGKKGKNKKVTYQINNF